MENFETIAWMEEQCQCHAAESHFTTKIIPSIYVLIILFGVLGNAFVIYLTNQFRRKTIVDIYVTNLAIADGLLIMSSVTTAVDKYNGGDWPFGKYGCKTLSFFSFVFMAASRYAMALLGKVTNQINTKINKNIIDQNYKLWTGI